MIFLFLLGSVSLSAMDDSGKGDKVIIFKVPREDKPPKDYNDYTFIDKTQYLKKILTYKICKEKLIIRITEKKKKNVFRLYKFLNIGHFIANVDELRKKNNLYLLTNYKIYYDDHHNKKKKKLPVLEKYNNKQLYKNYQSYFKKFDDWQYEQKKNRDSE